MLRHVRPARNLSVIFLVHAYGWRAKLVFALMTPTDVLAAARITRLITEDKIAEPFRDWVEGRFPNSKVAYLVSCPICVSMWAAVAVTVTPKIGRPVLRSLALSEATIIVRGLTDV